MSIKAKFIVIILLAIFIFPTINNVNVEGLNLAVGPAYIEIDEAFRNATYQHPVYIYNQNNFKSLIKINMTGRLRDWVEVDYPKKNGTDYLEIQNYIDKQITVKISIPETAENGEYQGILMVTAIPNKEDIKGNVSTLHLSTTVLIYVNVTGDQKIETEVQRIDILEKKVEMGSNVTFIIDIINKGNVRTINKINIEIFNKEGIKVDNLTEITNYIEPTNIFKSHLKWSTIGKIAGNYTAKIVVKNINDLLLDEKEIKFEIVPIGTLERKGILKEIYYKGDLKKGNAVKVIAVFRNNGESNLYATFYGEVYKNGNLIESIVSQKAKVEKYKEVELESLLKITDNAEYEIIGHVEYAGVESNEINYRLVVKEDFPYHLVFALIFIIFIIFIFLYLTKVKKYKFSFEFLNVFKVKIKALTSSIGSIEINKKNYDFNDKDFIKNKKKSKFLSNKKTNKEKAKKEEEKFEIDIEEMSAEEIEKYVESL